MCCSVFIELSYVMIMPSLYPQPQASARVRYQTSNHNYNRNYHRTVPLVEVWAWFDVAAGKPGDLAAGSDSCSDCFVPLVLQEEVLLAGYVGDRVGEW